MHGGHACTDSRRYRGMSHHPYGSTGVLVTWVSGTGKTSIAHTLSERLDARWMLGDSFFCSHEVTQTVL